MAVFLFEAKDPAGVLQRGQVNASSKENAAADLLAKKWIPILIEEVAEKNTSSLLELISGKGKVNLEDMVLFCRQMSVLVKSGVPLINSLQRLSETTTSVNLAQALQKVIADISGGQTLTAALSNYPKTFPSVMISVVDAGENSGRLDLSFTELSKHFMLEMTTKQRIKSATRYPMIVLVAIFIAIFVINFMVIPPFEKLFAQFNQELPLATRMLIASSRFMTKYWYALLAILLMIAFFIHSWLQTKEGRLKWDQIKVRIPIVGPIMNRIILARFAQTFSMVMQAGVPIVKGLALSANALDNAYMTQQVLKMRDGVERGEMLSKTAAQTGLFTPLVIQMLIVGEETGQVDAMLAQVAEFYEQEVDYDLSRLSSLLEPVILVILGIMIGILALAIFVPMWDMSNFAHQGR